MAFSKNCNQLFVINFVFRLHAATSTSLLAICAQAESLLLQTYNIHLPATCIFASPPGKRDTAATGVLQIYQPMLLKKHIPLAIVGDGNCMFRSLSRGLFGTEHQHTHIRLLTALEIIQNSTYYNTQHSQYNDIINDCRLVHDQYASLLTSVTQLGTYSEILLIYAASAALGVALRSYCPPAATHEFTPSAYTREVRGRGVRTASRPTMTLMWTTTYVLRDAERFRPNHLVVLYEKPSSAGRAEAPPATLTTSAGRAEAPPATLTTSAGRAEAPPATLTTSAGRAEAPPATLTTSAGRAEAPPATLTTSAGRAEAPPATLTTSAGRAEAPPATLTTSAGRAEAPPATLTTSAGRAEAPPATLTTSAGRAEAPPATLTTSAGRAEATPATLTTSAGRAEAPPATLTTSAGRAEAPPATLTTSGTSPSHNSSDISIDIEDVVKAEGGYDLPHKGYFLETSHVFELLRTEKQTTEEIPEGTKENQFYLINNVANLQRLKNKQKSRFWDDCGAWTCGPTTNRMFICDDNTRTEVTRKDSLYGITHKKQEKGKRQAIFTPLTKQPLPDEVIHLHRAYAKHSLNKEYRRRISWRDDKTIAVAEYLGTFPGFAPHGGNRSERPRKYIRTKPLILDHVKHEALTQTPSEVMQKRVEMDAEVGGLQSKNQIENARYRGKRQHQETSTNKANFADHILTLMNSTQTNEFVRDIHISNDKVPCVILYTDDQIQDIKRFCCSAPQTQTTVLGFDKTFNLGDIHVTLAVFKNLAITRCDSNEHPILPGPLFLHGNSDYLTYLNFFSHLSGRLQGTPSQPMK